MEFLALIVALALVALNGFFVATEFAIVKVRPTRIEELFSKGRPGAGAVRRLVRNIDGYLSATQLGITLASLGLGWIGEPAFASLIAGPLERLGVVEPHWVERISLTATFVIITFLHIVVGELAPKSLAIMRAESVALAAAYPMRFFYVLFFPAIWSLNSLANLLLRALGIQPLGHQEHHSEEELKIILAQARSAGLLGPSRAELLRKALTLPAKTARHLMVPRNEVHFLDANLSLQENLGRAITAGHTRFPYCNRELDDVLGVIDIRSVLFDLQQHPDLELASFAKPPVYFPEMVSGERLLTEFRTRRIQMAVIVDEYGGASGIVTAADLVSAVMGELDEDEESDIVPLPGGAYDIEGVTNLEEVEEKLKVSLPANEMNTVAGFLMERLGRMPRVGDQIFVDGYAFHVMEVAGPKVKRVRIQIQKKGAEGVPSKPPAA